MQSKKPRTTRGKPKARKRDAKPGGGKPERLKPISLYGMKLDEVIRQLLKRSAR